MKRTVSVAHDNGLFTGLDWSKARNDQPCRKHIERGGTWHRTALASTRMRRRGNLEIIIIKVFQLLTGRDAISVHFCRGIACQLASSMCFALYCSASR